MSFKALFKRKTSGTALGNIIRKAAKHSPLGVMSKLYTHEIELLKKLHKHRKH